MKILNGFHRAYSIPPIDRLFKLPRAHAIKNLDVSFPMMSSKYDPISLIWKLFYFFELSL